MKPSVYLAASFSRQAEMRAVAKRLRAIGVECTSRWLHEDQSIHSASIPDRQKFLKRCALTDIDDVRMCGIFVRFSDTEEMAFPLVRASLATGARHFETGLAWAIGRPIIIVGGHQNVFDWLDDNLVHLPDTNALIDYFTERVN